jgi:hypothetical protein
VKSFAITSLVVIAAAVAGCGSSGSSGTATDPIESNATDDVAVLTCLGALDVEPAEVQSCAADEGVSVIRMDWTGWGQDPAFGQGLALWNTCTPSCASGGHQLTEVVVEATNLKPCQGKEVYGSMRFAVLAENGLRPSKLFPAKPSYC